MNHIQIPTIHIVENSIPEAYYSAIKQVHEKGFDIRTQYDRKDKKGNYLDPPSRDARVFIEIKDPFKQPRFPVLSYCEIGKYIAEMLGAKNHLIVSKEKLLEKIKEDKEFDAMEWPYCYHQRLTAYPSSNEKINQLELIVNKLAKDPITRRAVAITGVPEIDLYMKADAPCLRELQLRTLEDEDKLILNTFTRWRSRDLYKAWGDNIIGLTNLLQFEVIPQLEEKIGKEVIIGPYSEENGSLHIYGQDYTEKGMNKFFEKFPTKESFVKRAMSSEVVRDALIIPQLKELKDEETWKFPKESIELINKIIEGYESKKFIP